MKAQEGVIMLLNNEELEKVNILLSSAGAGVVLRKVEYKNCYECGLFAKVRGEVINYEAAADVGEIMWEIDNAIGVMLMPGYEHYWHDKANFVWTNFVHTYLCLRGIDYIGSKRREIAGEGSCFEYSFCFCDD